LIEENISVNFIKIKRFFAARKSADLFFSVTFQEISELLALANGSRVPGK